MGDASYALLSIVSALLAFTSGYAIGAARRMKSPSAEESSADADEERQREQLARIRKDREAAQAAWERIQNYSLDDVYGGHP